MTDGKAASLDVGIVGAGSITEYIHAPLVSGIPGLNLSYVADIDPDRAALLSDYADEAIGIETPAELPECDVAVIATPVGVREEYHEEFARRNVPVFVEKPFATDLDTHNDLLEIHDIVFCDYMRTCFSSTRQLRSVVRSGVFGGIRKVSLTERGRAGPTGLSSDSYRLDPSVSGGGILMEVGCHALSQLSVIFEDHDKDVERADVSYNDGLDVQVSAELSFRSDDQTVPVDFHFTDIHPVVNQTVLEFEHGTVAIDQADPESKVSCYPRNADDPPIVEAGGDANSRFRSDSAYERADRTTIETPLDFAPAPAWASETHEAFYLRWRQFVAEVSGEDAYDPVVRTAPEVTQIMDEIYALG